jgi:clostripain
MSNKKIIFLIYISISLLITGCDLFNFDKPGTPEQFYAVQSGDSHVTVMWRNVENADSYTVFWSENPNPTEISGASREFDALGLDTRTVIFESNDFANGEILYFWVYAENSRGTSIISRSKKVSFSDPKSWTIMVWLDGDNNLADAAKEDFHEMEAGLFAAQQADSDIMANLKIIVQYDDRGNNGIYGRFEVQPRDTDPDSDSSNPSGINIGGLNSEPNMGDANELRDFIEYTKDRYDTDYYALILWNHGGGVRSVSSSATSREICQDETSNDFLYIGEIKDVLTVAESVDFLGMDACLMGMVEVAYEFRPGTGDFGAQTMTFSPAEEQVDGWEYDKILYRLSGSSVIESSEDGGDLCYNIAYLSPEDLATIVAKEYQDAFYEQPYETQTAVDLTKIVAVKAAVDELSGMLASDPSYKGVVGNIRGSKSDGSELMHYFDISSASEWENYAGFDLYDLAWRIRDSIDCSFPSDVQGKAENLMFAIEDAILYSWAGSGYNEGGLEPEDWENGLSIFFPDGDADAPNPDNSLTYWTYQYFYSSLPHSEIENWAGNTNLNYGAIDFCTGDGDNIVEGWFELLQFWFNPNGQEVSTSIHPGPMW